MNKDDLVKAVWSEIDYCETTKIRQNPSYTKTETSRLDLIDRYMLSQYRDGDSDTFGQPMVFYNIVSLPVEVASKQISFSTKDIQLIDEIGSYWETWLMEKELKYWMKDKYFGRQLNEWAFRLPRDGHIILKKVDNDVILVPLKSLRFRVDVDCLTKTPIIEKHEYQYDEFIKEAKNRGWTNYSKVKKIMENTHGGNFERQGKVEVYEVWFPEGFVDGKYNWYLISYDGHILAEAEMGEMYKGHAWEKVEGRLLGRGQVEKLFNEQIYLNRIANYKADALNWSSKQFFQTRDTNVNLNLLGNAENGDVFIMNDPLQKVPVEDRNLSFYTYEEGRIEGQAVKRTFTQSPMEGGRMPSGTPLGQTVLQTQLATGFYDQKKTELAMFTKEVLWDWIMPEFKKEKRKEHDVLVRTLLSTESGADKLFKMMVDKEMNKELIKGFMSPYEKEIKQAFAVEKVKNRKIKIPKGLYDNLKYKMEINIVGESIDTASKLTTIWQLLQMIGSNPAVVENPMTRDIIFKALNLAGFNPHDFKFEEDIPTLEEAGVKGQAMRGGSISAPVQPTTPQLLTSQQTL